MKPNSSRKHYLEILPAAYLAHRSRWQAMAQALPEGGCLLVTDPSKPRQAALLQTLTQSLRAQGRSVLIWEVS